MDNIRYISAEDAKLVLAKTLQPRKTYAIKDEPSFPAVIDLKFKSPGRFLMALKNSGLHLYAGLKDGVITTPKDIPFYLADLNQAMSKLCGISTKILSNEQIIANANRIPLRRFIRWYNARAPRKAATNKLEELNRDFKATVDSIKSYTKLIKLDNNTHSALRFVYAPWSYTFGPGRIVPDGENKIKVHMDRLFSTDLPISEKAINHPLVVDILRDTDEFALVPIKDNGEPSSDIGVSISKTKKRDTFIDFKLTDPIPVNDLELLLAIVYNYGAS